jgi:hypothetical protein
MAWQRIVPVVASVAIIILIAVLREYSKTLAAITATMPVTAPLSLWIVYAAEGGNRTSMTTFTGSMVLGILSTVLFLVATWLSARAGWSLIPIIVAGYVAWGLGLAIMFGLRHLLGV